MTDLLEIDQAVAAAEALAHGRAVVMPAGVGQSPVELPEAVSELVADALDRLSHGEKVRLISDSEEITTQQAADLLNVSRPYLVGLIDRGELPGRKVGARRRLQMVDVLLYRDIQRARQRAAIDQLANEAQELGVY